MALLSTLLILLVSQVPEPAITGSWVGRIAVPGAPLAIRATFARDAKGWSGTIDIPQQGSKGLPLEAVRVKGRTVAFAIGGVPGSPRFEGTYTGDTISGTFTQGGASIKFELGRAGTPAAEKAKPTRPARPQEPKPPFPYRQEDVTYKNGKITLAGTLTLPESPGPFPAVLLITGSGAQNRNEELLGHKPFLVIADHLTRHGFAVLRVDDRGVGGSSGNTGRSTSADFAGDVIAGVHFLQEHDAIFEDAVGVLGHSEGGLVGPLAASQCDDIAFVIMLAGPGVPGEEILYLQSELILRANGASDDAVASQRATQEKLFALMRSETDEKTLKEKARKLLRAQIEAMSEAERKQLGPLDAYLEGQVAQFVNPWMRFFLTYDPRPALRKVKVPILVLNGEKDLQVWYQQNLPEIEKALQEGGNDDVTIKSYPGLNHLFQHCTTGRVAEYARITETISPDVLADLTDWLLERF